MEKLEFGNKVKLARIEANLTQQELADQVGVTRQTIGLIEAEKYNPTIQLCLLIARTTQKNLDELFFIKGE
ncbi:MAG: helix-turn-helix transcriptional regulator [Anaerolineales bacterium]|jgi:putative transcriptional regulator